MKRVVLIFLSLLSLHAWPYAITQDFSNGFYWQSLPLGMIVSDSNSSRQTLINSLTQSAHSDWENALSKSIWDIYTPGTNSTSNIIRWSTNFGKETGLDESSVLAVTIRYVNGPYMTKAEIIINGNNAFNQYQQYLRTVLVHELGHTMGLDHSNVPNAVMAASLVTNYSGLTSDDIQGMKAVLTESDHRQAIGYISPLAYEKESKSTSPLNCGTVDMGNGSGGSGGGPMILSLMIGFLIALVGVRRPIKV